MAANVVGRSARLGFSRSYNTAALLQELLSKDRGLRSLPKVDDWKGHYLDTCKKNDSPFANALYGAFLVDRLGFAFATGYQSALQTSFNGYIKEGQLGAFCVTEADGRPRSMKTQLSKAGSDAFHLNGVKSFVTLGTHADTLFVVAKHDAAKQSDPREHVSLKVVRVDSRAKGVALEELRPLPFIPEVPHASVRFDNVVITHDDVLPLDGYTQYVKPFRTTEDAFVSLAIASCYLGWCREYVPDPVPLEDLLAIICALAPLSDRAVAHLSATHLALASTLRNLQLWPRHSGLAEKITNEAVRKMFLRDVKILQVAEKARAARRAKALATLLLPPPLDRNPIP